MIGERTETDREIAERATAQGFLNCYLRETGAGEIVEASNGTGEAIRFTLRRQGVEVSAPLRYRSPTGRHLFRAPLLYRTAGRGGWLELDYLTLAALTTKELSLEHAGEARADDLVVRVVESCRNVERFVRDRRGDGDRLYALRSRFIEAEQALVFGHHMHPAPKSRQDFAEEDLAAYSPELKGSFPLHYFRAHGSLVREVSALEEPAAALIKAELRRDPAVDERFGAAFCGDDGYALIPTHPWQAGSLLRRPDVRELLERGLLEYLGPRGTPYRPTSSVRTVYREDARFMPKLSLNVRITNSVRANLLKELERGVEVHRLMEGPVGRELGERFPRFGIVRDPAYLTLDLGDGEESGFEVVLRQNPYRGEGGPDATPLISLCQDDLSGTGSRLARILAHLAEGEGRPAAEVSLEWFRRYLDVSLRPILWLYFTHGIAVEAHGQNSVVELEDGYPSRFLYRDNQGYYYRESAREHLEGLMPGIGAASETFCEEAVSDERLRYYLFINNLFGLVNAFGAAGLADERALLAELRTVLEELKGSAPASSALIPSLLREPKLPCKANLLTRFHDMDELVGDMATQSVYVRIDNPLHEEGRS